MDQLNATRYERAAAWFGPVRDFLDTSTADVLQCYAVGPPLTAADPDRLDSNELEALRSRPNMFDRFALSNLTPEPMSLFRDEGG